VLRILRVFKLARHNTGLQVLVKTGMAARHELGQVLFCFSISVVLFAAVVFYTEEHVTVPYDKPFTSIPHSMWWAIITLCTVGYGDMSPITPLGRLLGCMCCVCGVVMVALPISVISSTFQDKYEEHLETQKIQEAKRHRENEKFRSLRQQQYADSVRNVLQSYLPTPKTWMSPFSKK